MGKRPLTWSGLLCGLPCNHHLIHKGISDDFDPGLNRPPVALLALAAVETFDRVSSTILDATVASPTSVGTTRRRRRAKWNQDATVASTIALGTRSKVSSAASARSATSTCYLGLGMFLIRTREVLLVHLGSWVAAWFQRNAGRPYFNTTPL